MECGLLGPYTPFLVAPNFQVTPSALISVRPWIAWYTAATGWRWLGTTGVNSSSWYLWSASPFGVWQWVTSAGALNRWTWAPIRVRPGRGIYKIGAFELIYWYTHPRYVWAYVSSRATTSAAAGYCAYP